MAIITNFITHDKTIENAYLRVDRIWGSKQEGWNGWMGVYASEEASKSEQTLVPAVHISTPYIEGENPFTLLYAEITNRYPVVASPVEVVQPEPEVVTTPVKKTRKAKNPS